jgi:hypothetical protein
VEGRIRWPPSTPFSEKRALPAQPSLEHLRKESKQRLAKLRVEAQGVQLGEAQLLVAREYGFPSWSILKAEVERRAHLPRPAPTTPSLNQRPVARRAAVAEWDGNRLESVCFQFVALGMILTQILGATMIFESHNRVLASREAPGSAAGAPILQAPLPFLNHSRFQRGGL